MRTHSLTHIHAHILFLSLSHTHICTHIYTCYTQTHTYTERTKMMNTWYKLFNIISTHMKRTCIHSCSVRSLIITHAIHTLPVMIIIIQHCLSLPSILANQTNIHTKSKTKLSSQFSTELKKHVKKCISVHPKTSEFQCKLAEDIACSLELKFCYVQNWIQIDVLICCGAPWQYVQYDTDIQHALPLEFPSLERND